ncbi:CLUMA_CG015727, isoform A [Clunio marinus]|uniref:CLUMA_CG015727, isoform A n=1 Tax=Clunio marinus TaxID=568069 RepID=A0A1J1IRY5_9DIPT|nr:CLUMA_CG015727, isoform A [Clunio marinus]
MKLTQQLIASDQVRVLQRISVTLMHLMFPSKFTSRVRSSHVTNKAMQMRLNLCGNELIEREKPRKDVCLSTVIATAVQYLMPLNERLISLKEPQALNCDF